MCGIKWAGVTACIVMVAGSISCAHADLCGADRIKRYNYAWNVHSEKPGDSMPLGNGDLAANVYVTKDALYLLLSKSDASDWNGNLIKTGRVKITAEPNPFADTGEFEQRLNIANGCIEVKQNGVIFCIWADANCALFHVEAASKDDIKITVEPEFWQRTDGEQDTRHDAENSLIWAHRNAKSVFRAHLATYKISHLADLHPDPFLNVTVGNLVESPKLKLDDGRLAAFIRMENDRFDSDFALGDCFDFNFSLKKLRTCPI